MGNCKSIVEINIANDIFQNSDFSGQVMVREEKMTNVFRIVLDRDNDEYIILDFEYCHAFYHNDNEKYKIKNIYFHKYKNLFNQVINCFIIRYNGKCMMYSIRSNSLYVSIFKIDENNIEDFTLEDLVTKSIPVFGKGLFTIDQESLRNVTINENIIR